MNSSKLFWQCFKRALVVAGLIEGFGAVVFVLGYFVIDGLGPVMEVLQFPSLQVLPFWDDSHFGNNPYIWIFAVDLLQFAIFFTVSLIAIYCFQRWKFYRPHLGEFAHVDSRSDDNFN